MTELYELFLDRRLVCRTPGHSRPPARAPIDLSREPALLNSRGNFDDLRRARVQRLSTSIGRFLGALSQIAAIAIVINKDRRLVSGVRTAVMNVALLPERH
jgi:hypothetical protein